jgi:glycosyltransferase involved in cell wall biosynthesis
MHQSSAAELVSVVVPTRNRRARLLRTLKTIQQQTYPNLQIVVSDDGSIDGTLEALQRLEDRRVLAVRSTDGAGVSAARNRGIAAADGRWVAVCDDDDLWHQDKIADQVEQLTATGARWGFCSAISVTDDLEPMWGNPARTDRFAERLSIHNPVPGGCSTAIIERHLLEDVGGFDDELTMFADYDLWIRLHARAEPAALQAWRTLYVHDAGQLTQRWLAPGARELQWVRAKHPGVLGGQRDVAPYSLDRWLVSGLRNAKLRRHALRYVASEHRNLTRRNFADLTARSLTSRPRRSRLVPPPGDLVETVDEVRALDLPEVQTTATSAGR